MKKAPKSFEDGLQRLQELLTLLQDSATPLNEAVKLYAEAAELIAYCNGELANAQLQIDEIDAKIMNRAEAEQ